MTFGSAYPDVCLSSFSTPFRAYAAIITAPAFDGQEVIPVYDYTTTYEPSGRVRETSVISDITTLATGLAVADPVIVNWQIDDVGTFPSEYVKSLVARYSVPAPAVTSTPIVINGLAPTTAPASSPSSPNGLGTGAQVGIGIGVAVAAAFVGSLMIFWCLRRRRERAANDVVIPEMGDQDCDRSQRRWYNELDAQATQNELDSKPVHELPQPPAELQAHDPFGDDANAALEVQRNSLDGVRNDDGPHERA
ncbi:uncharacterized protein J4E87_010356 [Alternaria ethzedia]|uniref:uncharacterized protein n=1 Tax=Alternaria ethzedia TaxID=181014 RepID=UPI0020C2CFEB|nr:uncharacterized protein J4E87_010356 [Alternaria ethzedia]XP_051326787.1 uncharacterized protein J4E85_005713 [Alternaria conjuncta]KAI4611854.1 hypothetical protein J4E87_010356 [Alternaria ethzedia]KAI4929089.1 hypothetical protein J4E85_005713 [Alternaria conjuncta]